MTIAAENAGYAIKGKPLLGGVEITFQPGRLAVVIGPNGAGKSTLMRLLTGEIAPTTGRVLIGGRNLRSYAPADLAKTRAVVPQHTALGFPFSVIEVAQLGVTVPGLMSHGTRSRRLAEAMLDRVGLSTLAGRDYSSLSGGERQRVHIARALCQLEATADSRTPHALLVDEPTSSLDIAHQLDVLKELRSQADRGRIVVAILHDLNLAAAYADDILLLSQGRKGRSAPRAR